MIPLIAELVELCLVAIAIPLVIVFAAMAGLAASFFFITV